MEALESIFSKDNEIVEKLKEYAYKPDYKKLFFEHLGPELTKLYISKKDKVYLKNFLEASQYEYGFFNNKIDLQKAFSIYKKYADLHDYLCMYKMHVIYLCEYEKFNIPLNRVLEKIYILKCFAYFPNYINDWDIKLFEIIDVSMEIAKILDLEDNKLEKHQLFFELLDNERDNYNLSENDINLIKGVFFSYFHLESDLHILSFCELNSLIPKSELDYAYYTAKNKCFLLKDVIKLDNSISDEEIEKFYKEIEKKELYEFYSDYGNYLLDKKNNATPEIIKLFAASSKNGYLFDSFRSYQCLIDYYNFDEIIEDYNKAEIILNYILDEIVFEKLLFGQFILLMGLLIKYSKYIEKIISKYLIYVKEISEYINTNLIRKEKENEEFTDEDDYLLIIKAYLFYFGFKGIEEQNLQKALEYTDKRMNITKKLYNKKICAFFKYNIKKLMYSRKIISKDEFIKDKKDLIEFFYNNLNLKYQTVDCYIIGEDYFEGITTKKDEFNALLLYKFAQNIFCKTIIDCLTKNKIIKFLKYHENKKENKFLEDICSICYTNKPNKIFIPCKHNFCSFCADKLEEGKKCPICRSKVLIII